MNITRPRAGAQVEKPIFERTVRTVVAEGPPVGIREAGNTADSSGLMDQSSAGDTGL